MRLMKIRLIQRDIQNKTQVERLKTSFYLESHTTKVDGSILSVTLDRKDTEVIKKFIV